jgi:hypothetical protein
LSIGRLSTQFVSGNEIFLIMEQSGRNGHLEISNDDDQLDQMAVMGTSEWNQQQQLGDSDSSGRKGFLRLVSFVVLSGILLALWVISLSQHTKTGENGNTAAPATDSADGVDDHDDGGGGNNDASASIFLTCSGSFECLTDRIGHFQWIQQGQALCNDRRRFGLTTRGELVKETCGDALTNLTTDVLMSNSNAQGFRMTDHGHFQLVLSTEGAPYADNISNLLQDAAPSIRIEPTGQCLSQPKLECPYLHLRKSGDLVLNSINTDGSWSDRKVSKIFPDLFDDG